MSGPGAEDPVSGGGGEELGPDPYRVRPWYVGDGAEPPWRDLFLGGSPVTILPRLHAGDPLHLAPLCWDRLREVVLLIHPVRLYSRALASVAYSAALGYSGQPPLLAFLTECVDQAIEELLEEDAWDERQGTPIEPARLPRYADLVPRETGIEPGLSRRACVVFNSLPDEAREPFFRIVLEQYTVEEYGMQSDRSLEEIVAQIEATTRHLVLMVENGANGKEEKGS